MYEYIEADATRVLSSFFVSFCVRSVVIVSQISRDITREGVNPRVFCFLDGVDGNGASTNKRT